VQHALCDRAASVKALLDADFTMFDTAELLAMQSEREQHARADEAIDHRLQAALMDRATAHEIGGKSWTDVLATRMRLSRKDAAHRVRAADDLGPRHIIGGEVLEPVLPACAAALADGSINSGHITVIRSALKEAAKYLQPAGVTELETVLVEVAAVSTPETLATTAAAALYRFNQNGNSPDLTAHKRGFRMGRQDADGLTHVSGWVDAELAAYLGTAFDVWAAYGINNPDDAEPQHNPVPNPLEEPAPAIKSEPEPAPQPDMAPADVLDTDDLPPATDFAELADRFDAFTRAEAEKPRPDIDELAAVPRDPRSQLQRNHDALKVILRETLMSTRLGQHGGLPVTVVVSTTLAELEAGAGIAVTGTGTLMPMPDLIRLAEHAHHYLVVYRHHTAEPLYMGRSKRLATKAQRLLLYNRDRGCTRPGCTEAANRCQAHHANPSWNNGGLTDAPDLGLGCGPDNLLAELGWTNRIDPATGRVHWHPPPLMDTGGDTLNHHFHPEELLPPPEEDGCP
jgi:hypothetical protein